MILCSQHAHRHMLIKHASKLGKQSLLRVPSRGRVQVRASGTVRPPTPSIPYSGGGIVEDCMPSLVVVDNNCHEHLTRLTIDVADHSGLLRTITWVLNGMDLRVEHANLKTGEGHAHDTFWLTTRRRKKLTPEQAALLRERIQDFVIYCEPKCAAPLEWVCREVRISNKEHPQWTVLSVEGEPNRSGVLLELASVISGAGARVQEAYVQGAPLPGPAPTSTAGSDTAAPPGSSSDGHHAQGGDGSNSEEAAAASSSPQPPHSDKELVNVAPPGYDFSKGRYFKFLLSDSRGNKLDPSRVSALLFTYDIVMGNGHMPLVAPNLEAYLMQGAVTTTECG